MLAHQARPACQEPLVCRGPLVLTAHPVMPARLGLWVSLEHQAFLEPMVPLVLMVHQAS